MKMNYWKVNKMALEEKKRFPNYLKKSTSIFETNNEKLHEE